MRIARVGELVDIQDLMALRNEEMNEIGADKAGSACDKDFHVEWVGIVLTRFEEMG